jgi:hypothetical protein
MRYEVMVDDNFHYMDESERYKDGEFADATGAIERCRKIVDDHLESAYKVGMSASELWDSYVSFGEDPSVIGVDMPPVGFSAWDYAKERCLQICGARTPP